MRRSAASMSRSSASSRVRSSTASSSRFSRTRAVSWLSSCTRVSRRCSRARRSWSFSDGFMRRRIAAQRRRSLTGIKGAAPRRPKVAGVRSPFTPQALAAYLAAVHGRPVGEVRVTPLGGGRQGDKGYGYGIPLRIDYALDGAARRAVVETVRAGPFGHEHMADRAQSLLWAHDAFRRLPRHVTSLDVGAVRSSGALVQLGNAEELFMLAEFVEGAEYADDLLKLRAGEALAPLDESRCDALCDYLVEIHKVAGPDPGLYARRIRELVRHGQCIF